MDEFKERTNRYLVIELEPGTSLTANSGVIVSEIVDLKSTKDEESKEGYNFIVLNSGLNDITRPSLYGANHEMKIIKKEGEPSE